MNPISRILTSIKLRLNSKKFANGDYLEAYARNTDLVASIDPKMAIGGIWDEMGKHQFDFLVNHGLKPHHKLLDIGCGSLRGGLLFIDYLDTGNYTGFDLSTEVIKAGKSSVADHNLDGKKPKLLVNYERNLEFNFLEGQQFDFLLAQSVFSHLKPEHIEECFDNLHKVMKPGGRFFFTHHPGTEFKQRSKTDFEYPKSFFIDAAAERDLKVKDFSEEYNHPRGQTMLMLESA